MKKTIAFLVLSCSWLRPAAQLPLVGLVNTLVKKIINSLDLEVEKLQVRTIWMQNAQQTLENAMSEIQLEEIADWLRQTKDLYTEYYQELSQVKEAISDYDKVKQVVSLQEKILSVSSLASSKFKEDYDVPRKWDRYLRLNFSS